MSIASNHASAYPLHRRRHVLLSVVSIGLFIRLVLLSHSRMSQTFDEGLHLVAGYRYLQSGVFGINREHPPLVKMVAAVPF